MRAMNSLGMLGTMGLAGLLVALGLSPLALAGQEDEAALAGAVDGAVEAVGRAIPRERAFRLAVMPVTGPGTGAAEGGLGRWIAARATTYLVGRGIEVLDRSYVDLLREAERLRPNGPLDLTTERLVAVYLQSDGALSGALHDVGEAYELTLRLVDARAGKVLETATARFAKGEATAALERAAAPPAGSAAVAAEGPPRAPSALGPALRVERAVFVERRKADGGYDAPEPWNGAALAKGDRIQIRVRPLDPCYIHVIVFESDGGVRRLFPEGDAPGRVEAGAEVKLPAIPGNYWYPLEEPVGTDTYFVIAEREPNRAASVLRSARELEAALANAQVASGRAKGATEAEGRKAAERQAAELWQLERMRAAELRARLDEGVQASALDFRVRQAFHEIASGAPVPDEIRARKLGAPVLGGSVDVEWEQGRMPLGLSRVEGSGRVIESFAIASK